MSRATVSRVINSSPKVSPEVQTAVEAAISELNYVPNRAARSLVARATMSIALVVPEDAHRFFGDPYFADIVQGITDRLDDSDYVLNLQLAHPSSPSEKTRRYLLGGNVDGALVVSHHSVTTSARRSASPYQSSSVVGRWTRKARQDVPPTTTSTSTTVSERCRGPGTSSSQDVAPSPRSPAPAMPAAVDREQGWRDALHAAGLSDERVAHADFSEEGGARAAAELLDRYPDVDAIFVASDLMASGALTTLAERGRTVPGTSPSSATTTAPMPSAVRPSRPQSRSRRSRWASSCRHPVAAARRRRDTTGHAPRDPPRAARLRVRGLKESCDRAAVVPERLP